MTQIDTFRLQAWVKSHDSAGQLGDCKGCSHFEGVGKTQIRERRVLRKAKKVLCNSNLSGEWMTLC